MAPATKTKTRARPREAKPALTKTTKADRGRNDVAELLRLMRAIEHRLQSSSKLMARDGGVTGPQRTVLRAITKEPGLSASDVAEVVQLHASTVTGILQRLLERGLVSRKKSDDDGRKAVLEVTDAGRKAGESRSAGPEIAVKRALGRFAAPDLAAAFGVLSAVAEELASD